MKLKKTICSLLILAIPLSYLTALASSSNEQINKQYSIQVKNSKDNGSESIFNNTNNYIENYTIQIDKEINADDSYNPNDTITFSPQKINNKSINNETLNIPLFLNQEMYNNMQSEIQKGNHVIIRSIAINSFLKDSTTGNFLAKEDYRINAFSSSKSYSEQQNFDKMYALIIVSDVYNSNRTQKKHQYYAYHTKYESHNNSNSWVSTTSYDNRPDVISLSWNIGGAIGLNDSSISLYANYERRCPVCPRYSSLLLRHYSSGVSKHNSLFTGNSIGFNIPDYASATCSQDASGVAAAPLGLILSSDTGWYNVGAYNGASGTVRTDYIHGYKNKTITISPNISVPPGSISLSISGANSTEYEKSWVYAVVSPN